jgi:hypothetical protein
MSRNDKIFRILLLSLFLLTIAAQIWSGVMYRRWKEEIRVGNEMVEEAFKRLDCVTEVKPNGK